MMMIMMTVVTTCCCRGDVVQHRPGEQEGDGDGPRVAGGRPREHLQGQEGRAPRLMHDPLLRLASLATVSCNWSISDPSINQTRSKL